MTNEPDPLEHELGSWRPGPISPELRDRLAERLNAKAPAARSLARRRWVLGVGLAVAAGGTAAAILLLLPDRSRDAAPAGEEIVMPNVIDRVKRRPDPPPESPPILGEYRRALARSPEALEELYHRQAPSRPPQDRRPPRLGAVRQRVASGAGAF